MTKRKPSHELKKRGRKSTFLVQYVNIAKRMAYMGATDRDLAVAFSCTITTIWDWKAKPPAFADALVVGKKEADQKMIRSLYQRGLGYHYDAVKIFMPAGAKAPIYAPYVEHIPPDPASAMFWLKNRDSEHWRDVQNIEHAVGRYVISDKPMSEEDWVRERAVVIDAEAIDATPALEDQSKASHALPSSGENKPKRGTT
jgi:hypothetical protein